MKIRSGFVSLAVIATAFTGTVVASGTASASSGGGCDTQSISGESIKGCVSASGAYLEPDGYVLQNAHCSSVDVSLVDDTTGNVVLTTTYSCALGHKGPIAYRGTNGHTYHTMMDLVPTAGGYWVTSLSPNEVFND